MFNFFKKECSACGTKIEGEAVEKDGQKVCSNCAGQSATPASEETTPEAPVEESVETTEESTEEAPQEEASDTENPTV